MWCASEKFLVDIFPTGSRAGGAPFNVAYNLFKMGIDTKMLSRIGNDDLGHRLLNQIRLGNNNRFHTDRP